MYSELSCMALKIKKILSRVGRGGVLFLKLYVKSYQSLRKFLCWWWCWFEGGGEGGTVGSDVTLREKWSVFIRCRTMPLGAAIAL